MFFLVLMHFLALHAGGGRAGSGTTAPTERLAVDGLASSMIPSDGGQRQRALPHSIAPLPPKLPLLTTPAPPLFAAEEGPRLNSLSYANRISNERWTPEDTELFYKVGGRLPNMLLSQPRCCVSLYL